MSLRINDEAPNFTAETTQGTINFHDWIGNGWPFCFRIPKILRRSARPSWATWRDWRRNSPSATPRLLG